MVRRRGYYEIEVMGKQLSCPHCEGVVFSHREIYLDVARILEEQPMQQLTLQSFACKRCAHFQQFQEFEKGSSSNLVYKQVEEP